MACRYLELVVSDKKANPDNSGADDKKWFVDWYKVVNIPSKTAYRMWDEFNIPAHVIHVANGDEEIVEIAENLHRNDLSKEERKVMACRYLELLNGKVPPGEQVPKKSKNPKGGQPESWFSKWYEVTGIPRPTAQRMWDEFKVATGLTITPSKASVEQQQAFAAWHLEQSEQKKRDDEKRKQQSEEEAAKAKTQREFDAWMEKIEVIVKWLKETPVVDAKLLLLAALDES